MEKIREIELYFHDLEILLFKRLAIKNFTVEKNENREASEFEIAFDKEKLFYPAVSSLVYQPGEFLDEHLKEYLETDYPSVQKVKVRTEDGNEQEIIINWSILPNTSLQDCMCEPVNGNAYSAVSEKEIIVGATRKKQE